MKMAKTTISVHEDILRVAEQLAHQMNISRSRLFSLALSNFIQRRKNFELLEQINKAYEDAPDINDKRWLREAKRSQRRFVEDKW
jgi:predicted transcriptional regulator